MSALFVHLQVARCGRAGERGRYSLLVFQKIWLVLSPSTSRLWYLCYGNGDALRFNVKHRSPFRRYVRDSRVGVSLRRVAIGIYCQYHSLRPSRIYIGDLVKLCRSEALKRTLD